MPNLGTAPSSQTLSFLIATNRHYVDMEVKLISQNAGANTSVVEYNMYLRGKDSGSTITSTGLTTVGFSCDGNAAWNLIKAVKVDIKGTEKRRVLTQQKTLSHNAEGKRGTWFGPGSWEFAAAKIQYAGKTIPKQVVEGGQFNLPQINRATTPRIAGTVTMESATTITTTAADSSFRHKLWVTAGNKTVQIADNVQGSTSYTFRASDFASLIQTGTTVAATLHCQTKVGSTTWEKTQNFTLALPTGIVPVVSDLLLSEAAPAVANIVGVGGPYVQDQSIIKFKPVITPGTGYTGDYTGIEFDFGGGYKITSTTLEKEISLVNTKLGSGAKSVKVTVTDRRGRTGSKSFNFNIAPWALPKITTFTGTRQPTGTKADFKLVGSVSSLKNGAVEKNTYSATIEMRKAIDPDTAYKVVNTQHGTFTNVTIDGFAVDSSYSVRVKLTDQFSTATTIITLSTAKALLCYFKDIAVGIGHLTDGTRGVLDILGQVSIEGNLNVIRGGNIMTDGQVIANGPAGHYFGDKTTSQIILMGDKLRFAGPATKNGAIQTAGDLLIQNQDGSSLADIQAKNADFKGVITVGDGVQTILKDNQWVAGAVGAQNMYIRTHDGVSSSGVVSPGALRVQDNTNLSAWRNIEALDFVKKSAYSMKTNFQELPEGEGLKRIRETEILSFEYKTDPGFKHLGFIIDDNGESPYKTDPGLINEAGDGFGFSEVIFTLFKAVQELDEIVKDQNETIKHLKKELRDM